MIDREEEIKKCANNVFYFIENYVKIKGKDGKLTPFKLFDYQRRTLNTIENHKYVVICKARQLGISTLLGAYALWYCAFKHHKEVVIVSLTDNEAMYFIKRIKLMIDYAPDWLIGDLVKDTEHQIMFDTNSYIEALPSTKKTLRGRTPSIAIIDEAAFNRNIEEMMSSALPSLTLGEHLVLISTPNYIKGVGQYFYTIYNEAKEGKNEFVAVDIDWWECPLYNPEAPKKVDWRQNEWALQQFKNLKEIGFRREILREFIPMEETVIPLSILGEIESQNPVRTDFLKPINISVEKIEKISGEIDFKTGYIKGLWVWKDPQPNHLYVIGVDVATGKGKDFSAIEILDVDSMEQVAEYRGRVTTSIFSEILYNLYNYYNKAFLSIEVNAYGEGVINELLFHYKLPPEKFYHRMKGKKEIIGWQTNEKSRSDLIISLQDVFYKRAIRVYSYRLLSELKSFVWSGGKAQALKGTTDDLVFAFMIAYHTIPYFLMNLTDEELEKYKENWRLHLETIEEDLNLWEEGKVVMEYDFDVEKVSAFDDLKQYLNQYSKEF